MDAIVLAAGYATRLYPITKNFPKPLLPVGGRAILSWLLQDAARTGAIDRFVVVSNHRYKAHFDRWARDTRLPGPVLVLDDGSTENDNRLGAVRDIAFAVDALGATRDALVLAGDNVLDFSLGAFVAYFQKMRTSCIMRYIEPDEEKRKRSGVVEIGENDRVLSMREKPEHPASEWCVPPFYAYTAGDLALVGDALRDGCKADAPGSFVEYLAKMRPVSAMVMPGKRFDVGNLESYRAIRATYTGLEGIV